jgi:hypothetical protein
MHRPIERSIPNVPRVAIVGGLAIALAAPSCVQHPREPAPVTVVVVMPPGPAVQSAAAPETSAPAAKAEPRAPLPEPAAVPRGIASERVGAELDSKARGVAGREPALAKARSWLEAHQSPDGRWDSDGFMANCDHVGTGKCSGAGQPGNDVAVTGLALLAFLAGSSTTKEGPQQEAVARGIRWLVEQQDPDQGLLGEQSGKQFMYNHAIGTLALCEAYYFSKEPELKRPAQDAVNFIIRSRNPYAAWRYEYPPNGDNDTSVTGWMVCALKSAEEGGLEIDPQAYAGALGWIDEVTDPETGRVGYDRRGSLSSRIPNVNSHFPPEKGEAMTAVGLLCRFFIGQDPKEVPIMERHAQLIVQKLPVWAPDDYAVDMIYWYFGTYAMYQMGGERYWDKWNKAMKPAVVDSLRRGSQHGDEAGSWDPVGPWGFAGGRVYSTALMTLCILAYYRYSRALGGR